MARSSTVWIARSRTAGSRLCKSRRRARQYIRVLRWTFRRDRDEAVVCELALTCEDREYELRAPAEWNPTGHPNTYQKALQKLVASKRTFAVGATEKGEAPAKVVDLMDALRKSLGQEKRRGCGKAATRRRSAA